MVKRFKESSILKIIIPLSVTAVVSRAFPSAGYFYYLFPLSLLIIFYTGYKDVIKNKILRNLFKLLLVFGFWCIISSLWSHHPLITLSRSAYFIFISAGSILCGYLWNKSGSERFSFLLPANIIVIALSIFSLVTNIPADSWTGGHGKGFMGFAGHQNTLASALLFTLPGILSQKPKVKNQSYFIAKIFLWLLLFLNLAFLILTYSRTSIISLVCGAIIFLILSRKWNTLAYSVSVSLVIFFMIYFSPSLSSKANELIKKDFPSFLSSREWLLEPTYRAALNNGLIGLGYGMSDPSIILPGTGSHYEGERYVREKGNSFLALIEEVGIIGFVLFLLPFAFLFKSQRAESIVQSELVKYPESGITSRLPSALIISILITLIIHSQFEAWLVGVGSIQLPLFFTYSGFMIKPE